MKKILRFFGVDAEKIDTALSQNGEIENAEEFTLSSETVEEKKRIKLYFKETI